jgi:glycerol-3-phosphate acyltransferase PlsY
MLGHVFSPFLRVHGGKALATALGVWIGLTIWKIPLVVVVSVTAGIAVLSPAGWAVMVALGAILAALLIWMPDPVLLMVWAGEFLLLAWTHRVDLTRPPHLRAWLRDRKTKSGR